MPQWEKHENEDGIPFYHHPVTGVTVWERPAGYNAADSEPESESEEESEEEEGLASLRTSIRKTQEQALSLIHI